jgi:hypothetical protein
MKPAALKPVIPAGRIVVAVWFAAALSLALVMALCPSCGATPASAAASCTR